MSERLPSKIAAPLLDWRASRIQDPVARLRFLRLATSTLAGRQKTKRHVVLALGLLIAGSAAVPFRGVLSASQPDAPSPKPAVAIAASVVAQPVIPDTNAVDGARIWQVESTREHENYSNGLRVEKKYTTSNRPRPKYRVFRRNNPSLDSFEWRDRIAGIVFHTTESHLAPFEKDANDQLRRAGRNILAEVQQRRSYNYVIDRFGRVWRVVEDSDVAWHAGKSIWADSSGVYVNLNDSFIGVSFEAQTRPEDGQSITTEAQIHSAKLLTDMLRAKHNISAENCTTHAQVSVSLASMRVGYHTDWASGFPYQAVGLPNNYMEALPSIWTFGFDYDQNFVRATGNQPWAGLALAEQKVREQAALAGVPVAQYKLRLHHRYKELIAALYSADEEQANES